MMDCKKALTEADEIWKKRLSFCGKRSRRGDQKAGRVASEGIVLADVKNDIA
jgi:translation elongation factor EF-Ts